MTMIKLRHTGGFKRTDRFFNRILKREYVKLFEEIGQKGVDALREATPKRTGKTAESWSYAVQEDKNGLSVTWTNSNRNDGASVAILIQLGHGTGSGAYVKGVDYINPALKPIFEAFAKDVWLEVTNNAYN